MLTGVTRELIIGAAGSIIGALFIYVTTFGWRLTQASRKKSSERLEIEIRRFDLANDLGKQMISQEYLFSSFRYFVIGNLLVANHLMLSIVDSGTGIFGLPVALAAAFAFVFALSKISRFELIKRSAKRSPSLPEIEI